LFSLLFLIIADLETISSSSKICWGQTPQILFLKPKDFVTYCSHRWLPDDTQIMINQATNYDNTVANAYAFRGATIIRRHPDHPSDQTQIYMLAHASPGSDIPPWAMKTAIKSLTPIEPFRLFYRMNQGIQQSKSELQQELKRRREQYEATYNNEAIEMVTNTNNEATSDSSPSLNVKTPVRNWLPGGIAQLGYACFWPEGGGPIEAVSKPRKAVVSISNDTTSSDVAPDVASIPMNEEDTTNTKAMESQKQQVNGPVPSKWQPDVLHSDDESEKFAIPSRLM
jgi:hypothetical protein